MLESCVSVCQALRREHYLPQHRRSKDDEVTDPVSPTGPLNHTRWNVALHQCILFDGGLPVQGYDEVALL